MAASPRPFRPRRDRTPSAFPSAGPARRKDSEFPDETAPSRAARGRFAASRAPRGPRRAARRRGSPPQAARRRSRRAGTARAPCGGRFASFRTGSPRRASRGSCPRCTASAQGASDSQTPRRRGSRRPGFPQTGRARCKECPTAAPFPRRAGPRPQRKAARSASARPPAV